MVANLPGIRPGAICEIGIESPDGYAEFRTRVEDYDEGRLVLGMPSKRGTFIPLMIGDPVQVMVPAQAGGTLFLEGQITGRRLEPLPLISVEILSVGLQQSRGYFRINLVVRPTECSVWDVSVGPNDAFWRPVRATVQDMSGGGVGLLADEPVQTGSKLRIRFPLPVGGGECNGSGEVKLCRPHRAGDGGPARWIVGVQLDALTRPTRERLIKAVHRHQAEERRLGELEQA